MTKVRGKLLVATPMIEAGPFRRAVVFVLDHDDDGALGVIVNRPLDSDVDEILPEWAARTSAPGCLFDGGPVAVDSALGVGLAPGPKVPIGWRQMSGRVGLVDLDAPVPPVEELSTLRIFAGYAGWSAGQLEDEIDDGSWFVLDALESDLTSARPETLWSQALQRQAGELSWMANFPDDPSDN
jgi:putative transcriptional regulator